MRFYVQSTTRAVLSVPWSAPVLVIGADHLPAKITLKGIITAASEANQLGGIASLVPDMTEIITAGLPDMTGIITAAADATRIADLFAGFRLELGCLAARGGQAPL